MAKTPKRLFGPALLSNADALKYTVPAGTKTIIRHIHVENNSGSAATLFLSIGADAAGTRLYDGYSIPAAGAGVVGSVLDVWCYYVLDAAETIRAHSGTDVVLGLTLDGDELTLG